MNRNGLDATCLILFLVTVFPDYMKHLLLGEVLLLSFFSGGSDVLHTNLCFCFGISNAFIKGSKCKCLFFSLISL